MNTPIQYIAKYIMMLLLVVVGVVVFYGTAQHVRAADTVDLKVDGYDTPPPYTDPATYEVTWEPLPNTEICTASGDWSGNKDKNGGAESFTNSVGSYTYGIECINVPVTTGPEFFAHIESPNNGIFEFSVEGRHMVNYGNYLYVLGHEDGAVGIAGHLYIYDASDPTSPNFVRKIRLTADGQWAYFHPSSMRLYGDELFISFSGRPGLSGSPVLRSNTFEVYSLSNPASPSFVGGLPRDVTSQDETNLEDIEDFVKVGDYMYTSVGSGTGAATPPGRMGVYDVSDRANMYFVKLVPSVISGGKAIVYHNDYLYVGDSRSYADINHTDLVVFDVSDRENPNLVNAINLSNEFAVAKRLNVFGSYLYVSAGNMVDTAVNDYVYIYDISSGTSLNRVGGFSGYINGSEGTAQDIVFVGDHMHVSFAVSGPGSEKYFYQIFDASNQTNPVRIGEYAASNSGHDIEIIGGYTYILRRGDIGIYQNVTTDSVEVTVDASGLGNNTPPNLTSTNLTLLSGTLEVGANVRFEALVENASATATPSGFSNEFSYRYGTSGAWNVLNETTHSPLLGGGSEADASSVLTLTLPGELQVQHCVDSRWEVVESDEIDNCDVATFTVASLPPPPPIPDPLGTITATPLTILSGSDTTLTWSTSDAHSCTIEDRDTGAVYWTGDTGNGTISLADDTTFDLRCDGDNGDTDRLLDSVTVTTSDAPVAGPLVNADKRFARFNEPVTLNWNTNGIPPANCSVFGSNGYAYTPTPLVAQVGSAIVSMQGTTEYTIDCGVDGSDSVTIELIPGIWEA